MSPGPVDAASAKKSEQKKAEEARPKRPKWRLCFRLDRRNATAKESLEDLAPKYQRDFFLTVIDPPWHGVFKDHPPAPFFASRSACHVADLVASRHMISTLPGRSFEGKVVCVVGAECMAAGLVAAMLGAKVMFVCERHLEPYFQHNVRLFRRDALDYTKTKGKTLLVTACNPGRSSNFDGGLLAEKLQAPSLDIIVMTEASVARCVGDLGGILGGRRGEATSFFRMLGQLVPAHCSSKILLICDQSPLELMEEPRQPKTGDGSMSTASWSLQGSGYADDVPPGMAAVLPMDWQGRTFCQLPQNVLVVWLDRPDPEVIRKKPAPLVCRPPMPPMGASSSRCGCGGHLQSPLLGQRVENEEWFTKNAQLKQALMKHNSLKQMQANGVLREARAWADSVAMSKTPGSSTSLLHQQERHAAQRNAAGAQVDALFRSPPLAPVPLSAREGRDMAQETAQTSQITSTGASGASRSARGPNIAQRHASPPFWYKCNRAVYGRPPMPSEASTISTSE